MDASELYTLVVYPQATAIPQEERRAFLATCDRIADRIWHKPPHYWAVREALFADNTAFLLVQRAGETV